MPTHAESSRRGLMRGVAWGAAGLSVLAVGGLVYRAANQRVLQPYDGPAWQPWADWRTAAHDGPPALVAAAILAANAHNTQPWLFRIDDNRIDVFADARRALGALDPYRRELVLSLGCALENLMTAARGLGYDAELALLPDPEDATHAARITLTAAAPAPDAAFAHIGGRHTNRGPYNPAQPVLLDTFHGLVTDNVTRLLLFDADSPEGRRIGERTVQATAEIIADHEMAAASYAWMRHEWDDIQRHRAMNARFAAGFGYIQKLGLFAIGIIRGQNFTRPA